VAFIFRGNTSNIGILPLPLLPRAPDKSEIIPFVLNTIREGQEEPFTLIFVAFRGKEGRKRGEGYFGDSTLVLKKKNEINLVATPVSRGFYL